ncbi:MAG: hypothetical protein HY673_10380 [Chloroflexi bacterium]|nr:hypothetical protein [Chloroflexota bacterium]
MLRRTWLSSHRWRCPYIRHNYTKHEDRLVNGGLPFGKDDGLYREIKSEANDAVDKFLRRHR